MHFHTLMNDLKCWLEFCKLEFKFLLMLSVDESATIRVTNLSEDTRESDLQELFRPFGPIQRIYLAKDKNTGQSKVCQLICNWCIRTLKTKNSLNFFLHGMQYLFSFPLLFQCFVGICLYQLPQKGRCCKSYCWCVWFWIWSSHS